MSLPRRAALEECLPILRAVDDPHHITLVLLALAQIARMMGESAAMMRAYLDALSHSRDHGDAGHPALCLEGLAAAALAPGNGEIAARLLGAAQAAHAAGFTPFMPGFEHSYEQTAAAVERVVGVDAFADGLARGRELTLAQAMTLARELTTTSAAHRESAEASSPTAPDGLSAREVEVLALLAGTSNPEIAAALARHGASRSGGAARPATGWAWACTPHPRSSRKRRTVGARAG